MKTEQKQKRNTTFPGESVERGQAGQRRQHGKQEPSEDLGAGRQLVMSTSGRALGREERQRKCLPRQGGRARDRWAATQPELGKRDNRCGVRRTVGQAHPQALLVTAE